jgi:cell division protein FtsB
VPTRPTKKQTQKKSPRIKRDLLANPATRIAVNIVGVFVVVLVGVSLFFIPAREYFTQRTALAQKNKEFNTLADANEQLQNEVNNLQTPEGAAQAARQQLGYVLPGEHKVTLLPMPALPTTLPTAWPYSVVSNIVAIRANSAGSGGALNGLAP